MKLGGALLLTVGFLAGAYVAVNEVASVNWTHYAASLALMLGGMVLLRWHRAVDLEASGDRHAADIEVLRSSLEKLTAKVRGLEEQDGDEAQLEVHGRIDSELMEDINAFVEARESMIPLLGMNHYAEVMSPFANAERLLNRAWSASADGYVDEVRLSVRSARLELEKASAVLAAAP